MTILTAEQRRQYADEGWVGVGRVLDDAALEALRAEEARARAFEPYDPNATIFRSQMARYSAVVRALIQANPLVGIAAQLVGPNVAHWFNQFVTKMPDGNRRRSDFPWHQDNGYVSIEPPNNVTIWIALDDVDTRNGCVWVLPGSHLKGLLDHRAAGAESWHLTVKVEGDGIPAVLKAGEAVAFTGLTLHRSKLNQTDQPRRAFFVEYADPRATFHRPGDAVKKPLTEAPDTWLVAGQMDWPEKADSAGTTHANVYP